MNPNEYIEIKNAQPVDLCDIPVLDYDIFYDAVSEDLKIETHHCITYHCVEFENRYWFVCCIACDENHTIRVYSHEAPKALKALHSITPDCPQLYLFEREIQENFGIHFEGHPWLKPVRWPSNRADKSVQMNDYDFFKIDSEELHEVGVGPIHAGIIEPGHFRFICHGEKVKHLEIHLGYQHRGAEQLFITSNPLQRTILTESVAGDTSVGASTVHARLIEALADIHIPDNLQVERYIAMELERIAVHIGDTSALSTDVAYQFGQVVNEALRTTIINTTQYWCGNRFGKGLVRPGGSHYMLSADVVREIREILDDSCNRYFDIADRILTLPSLLARFDGIGIFSREQAVKIGAVGMAARTSGLERDIRKSHPYLELGMYKHEPIVLKGGDVLARTLLRSKEVEQSYYLIKDLLEYWEDMKHTVSKPNYNYKLKPSSFAISMAEAWRGELCHCAITDEDGNLYHYKIKDPSFHNWMALALAVRNQEISDFPVCNKSFNLSYCGYDI